MQIENWKAAADEAAPFLVVALWRLGAKEVHHIRASDR